MRVNVNWERCIHSGMCLSAAPTVFDIDDDGHMLLLHGADVAVEELDGVEAAIACCPAEALSLER